MVAADLEVRFRYFSGEDRGCPCSGRGGGVLANQKCLLDEFCAARSRADVDWVAEVGGGSI